MTAAPITTAPTATALSRIHPKRAALGVFLIFLADQLSKWWIVECVIKPEVMPMTKPATSIPFLQWLTMAGDQMPFAKLEVLPFFNIVMVWNKGVSFGLFSQHGNDWGPLFLILFSSVIVCVFSVWLLQTRRVPVALSLIMVIGGALGNIVDRVRFGAVADFLDFHVMGWHWPAFNLADSAITLGIVLLLVDGLFFEAKDLKKKKETVSS